MFSQSLSLTNCSPADTTLVYSALLYCYAVMLSYFKKGCMFVGFRAAIAYCIAIRFRELPCHTWSLSFSLYTKSLVDSHISCVANFANQLSANVANSRPWTTHVHCSLIFHWRSMKAAHNHSTSWKTTQSTGHIREIKMNIFLHVLVVSEGKREGLDTCYSAAYTNQNQE